MDEFSSYCATKLMQVANLSPTRCAARGCTPRFCNLGTFGNSGRGISALGRLDPSLSLKISPLQFVVPVVLPASGGTAAFPPSCKTLREIPFLLAN